MTGTPTPDTPEINEPAPAAPAGHRLTARELAPVCQVTYWTVLSWAQRGWIPCRRVGRRPLFDLEEVRAALRQRGRAI